MDEKPKRNRKRGAGEGAVYPVKRTRRRNGRDVELVVWEGYVSLPSVDGKQRRKYITRPNKQECQAEVRRLLNEKDAGTLSTTASPTLAVWLTHYLDDLAPKKRVKGRTGNAARTIDRYRSFAKHWIIPTIGKVKLDRLTVEHLEAVYARMAEAGQATASIRQCHATLSVALEMAWKRGRIARNPARQALLPVGQAPKADRDVELEEMRRVLDVARTRRLAGKWILRIAYGLRQGEALGLSWDRVDFDAATITIDRQLQRLRPAHGCGTPTGEEPIPGPVEHGCGEPLGETTHGSQGRALRQPRTLWPCGNVPAGRCPKRRQEDTGKTRPVWPCGEHQPARCPEGAGGGLILTRVKSDASAATLPLPGPIAVILKERRRAQRRERIQLGPDWQGWEHDGEQVDLVFSQMNGRPMDATDDWAEWKSILEEAGVEHIRPHSARSWAATAMVSLEVHPRLAMTLMRHADIKMTMETYARSPNPELRAAAEEQARLFLGAVSE
jgi:integrase